MFPTLFVGHGNPMYAIEENSFTETWRNLGETLPKPKAILCISAHWETVGTFVTAMPNPPTIHDFYGFPQALFEVEYKANGNPDLAKEIADKLNIGLDENWGLDHGTWSFLKHIYPKADVPVIQLSLDRTLSANQHYELSKKLQFLRNEDVLIIGSGNIVHNLRLINFRNSNGDEWAEKANKVLKELILAGDHESLINYQNFGNEVRLAIPTPEHYLPLLYVLALKNADEKVEFFNDVVELGSLSMTSIKVEK
jgi:4,5-DOPA dioxygenase extradiol